MTVETLPELRPPRRLVTLTWPRALPAAAWAVVGLTVLGAVLRFIDIGQQSFWYDEGFTVLLVQHTPGQMLGLLPQTELTPPLYYCVAWVWARIFGFGEAGLRSLSAVVGTAVVPAVYVLGARLISRRVGLAAAALAACNPLLIWYSQEARSYSLLILLTVLSLICFWPLRAPRPRTRALVLWAVVCCLVLTTHYFGALAVGPQALWLLWIHRRDRRVWAAVAVVTAVGLALLPVALDQRPRATWIPGWPLDQRLSQIPAQLVLGFGAPARTWLKLAAALALVAAGVLLARRAHARARRVALQCGALALAGFLITLALVPFGLDELITRNVIVILVPLFVLVAAGLAAHRTGWAGVAALCAVGVVAAIGVASDWQFQRPDWRGLARVLGPAPPPNAARAILIQGYALSMPLPLYMPGLNFTYRRGVAIDQLDLVAARAPAHAWFCWWGSACNLSPSRLELHLQVLGFHRSGGVVHVGQFSVQVLRSARTIHITPHRVARALRHTYYPQDVLLTQSSASSTSSAVLRR